MGGINHEMGLLLRFCEARSVDALEVAARKEGHLGPCSETQITLLGALRPVID
ncbi:hypothetical protein DFH06DRAFT_1349517 [Mycena polygramma]|nr:hypothetical protein DFH06DRAFT_1349517 [Mycena polygramma]